MFLAVKKFLMSFGAKKRLWLEKSGNLAKLQHCMGPKGIEVVSSRHKACTVNNKKTCTPCFSTYVFPVYLRNRLSYKKYISIFSCQFLRALRWNKYFPNLMT